MEKQEAIIAAEPEQQKSRESIVVQYFQNLTSREKLLIEAHSMLCCVGTGLDDRLRQAIKIPADFTPESDEERWLYAMYQFAEKAA